MKFFSRIMMVVALLAVLAYGSFAFGKYVLSAKLFGDDANSSSLRTVSRSTTEASAVTRQTGWKGTKPRVEVKVLPAEESGGSASLPAFADEDGFKKPSRSEDREEKEAAPRRSQREAKPDPTPAARLGKREFDNGSAEYSLGNDNDDEPRRTRRRRRTRKKSDSESKPARSESDSARSTVSSTSSENNSNGDSASSSVSTSSSSRERNSDSDSRESTRSESSQRESSRSEGTRSESSRNRESSRPRRERSRRDTSSSPIPRPEGLNSSGGDSASISPVPQPE